MFIESLIIILAAYLGAAPTATGLPVRGYEVVPVEGGGSITGFVRFDGPVPKAKILQTPTKDEVCHTEAIPDESLVVSQTKGVQWAVVSIKSIAAGKPFPKEPPVLDQSGCRFLPHVLVVPAGKEFLVLNQDGVLHNVHTHSLKNAPLNRSMRADVTELTLKFKRKETLSVTCDVHSWMKAWVVVASHPYYAVTDNEGAFHIDQVPPGTYEVRVWHEKLGKQQATVVVRANEASEVVFEMSSEKKSK